MLHRMNIPRDPYQYNGLALAYMGDAVYDVFVRQYLLAKGGTRAHQLHVQSTKYVSAKAQSQALHHLIKQNELTDQELEIVKRGRNAKSGTSPKNTEIQTYRFSTAFESLIGYLYLDDQIDRLENLIQLSFQILEEKRESNE